MSPASVGLGPEGSRPPLDENNPWPGLEYFRESESQFFKGRAAEAAELYQRIRDGHVTVLYGPSGIGKSSLVEAGLFPLIRAEHGLPIRVRFNFPEDQGVPPDLAAQVYDLIHNRAVEAGIEAPSSVPGETLWEYFHRRKNGFWDAVNRLVLPVLVFDQFEELFTLGEEGPFRRAATEKFIDQLADLVEGQVPHSLQRQSAELETAQTFEAEFDSRRHYYRVLISLRQDYLAQLDNLREKMPSLSKKGLALKQMNGDAALDVVKQADKVISADVAERVVRFVGHAEENDELAKLEVDPALLSVVCRELNDKRKELKRPMIESSLLEGERDQIVQNFYERSIKDISPKTCAWLEDQLIWDSGSGSAAHRDSVPIGLAERAGVNLEDLTALVEARILRVEPRFGQRWIELTHDLLIDVVQKKRDTRHKREQQERELERDKKAKEEIEKAQNAARRNKKIASGFAAVALLFLGALIYIIYLSHQNTSRVVSDLLRKAGETEDPAVALAYAADALDKDLGSLQVRVLLNGLLRYSNLAKEILPHGGAVLAASFNGDGTKVMTISEDQNAQLWDVTTGTASAGTRPIPKCITLGRDLVSRDLSSKGSLVVGCRDGTAAVYDIESGKELWFLNRPSTVTVVKFSADGQQVAVVTEDGGEVLDAVSGKPLGTALLQSGVFQVAISSHSRILMASRDGTATVWDFASGMPVRHLLFTPSGAPVRSIAFSSDGKEAAVGLDDGTAHVWNIDMDTELVRPRPSGYPPGAPSLPINTDPNGGPPPYPPLTNVEFSPDGVRLVVADAAGAAAIWNTSTMMGSDLRESGGRPTHREGIRRVRFDPGGNLVVTASEDNTARLWEVVSGTPRGGSLHHVADVYDVAFSPDGRNVVTASADGTARVWHVPPPVDGPKAIAQRAQPPPPAVHRSVDLSPDEKWMLSASGNIAEVWDVKKRTKNALSVGNSINRVRFSHDGRRFVVADKDGVSVWNVANWSEVGKTSFENSAALSASFSNDSAEVVAGFADGHAYIVDATTLTPTTKSEQYRLSSPISAAEFSPDRKHVVTASPDGTARIWQTDGIASYSLQQSGNLHSATFSHDSKRLLTASDKLQAKLWDVDTHAEIATLAQTAPIRSVVFNADDRLVLTTSDRLAQVWDAANGAPLGPPLYNPKPLAWATFTADNKQVLAVDEDGSPIPPWQIQFESLPRRIQSFYAWINAWYESPLSHFAKVAGGYRIVSARDAPYWVRVEDIATQQESYRTKKRSVPAEAFEKLLNAKE